MIREDILEICGVKEVFEVPQTLMKKQAEIVKYLDVIEKMEAKEETTIELLKQAKQTNLSDMFAE